jgi:hypothetical protein
MLLKNILIKYNFKIQIKIILMMIFRTKIQNYKRIFKIRKLKIMFQVLLNNSKSQKKLMKIPKKLLKIKNKI